RLILFFFFSSRRRHTRWPRGWSSDVCSSDLAPPLAWRRGRTWPEKPGWSSRSRRPTFHCRTLKTGCTLSTRSPGGPRYSLFGRRSEERRVGKECRGRGSWKPVKKKRDEEVE